MKNIKILYYNVETIDMNTFETSLFSQQKCVNHFIIKPGLLLINYAGTARDLYESVECVVHEKNIFIHDLDVEADAFWGFMNKDVWEWLKNNRN